MIILFYHRYYHYLTLYNFKTHSLESVREAASNYFRIVGNHQFPITEPIGNMVVEADPAFGGGSLVAGGVARDVSAATFGVTASLFFKLLFNWFSE